MPKQKRKKPKHRFPDPAFVLMAVIVIMIGTFMCFHTVLPD